MRNFRQALASPYPVIVHDPARLLFLAGAVMIGRLVRLAAAVGIATVIAACGTFRDAYIAELRDNPARYHDRSVNIDGVVTNAWGVPLLPFKLYKVDDGTGELTVVSQGSNIPTRGTH